MSSKQSKTQVTASRSSYPAKVETLIQTLLERTVQGGVLLVNNTGTIAYISNRAPKILGMSVKNLIGKNFYEAVPLLTEEGRLISLNNHPLYKTLKTGFNQSTPYFCKLKYSKKAKERTLALSITPILERGKIYGAVVTIRQTERTVNISEMKTVFLSFAAHQLKTPSGVVKGYLELLLLEGKNKYSKEQWEYLRKAFEASEQLIGVSKSLLNLTRLEGGMIAPEISLFDPVKVINDKVRLYLTLSKLRGIKITINAKKNFPKVASDKFLVAEVTDVLLSNAIKFSPKKGIITIKLSYREGQLQVSVADLGPGLSQDKKKDLINIQKTDYSTHHGMGLRLAQKYIALLKGHFLWKPNNPKGSTFSFSVPDNL